MKPIWQIITVIFILLISNACGVQQNIKDEASGAPTASATTLSPSPEVAPTSENSAANHTVAEDVALIWEGDPVPGDEVQECRSLWLMADNQAKIGSCGAADTSVELSADRPGGWSEILGRLAPFEQTNQEERIIFRGQGQTSSPAWERAVTAWARFTYGELASGRVSASVQTVLSWWLGEIPDQPGYCRQLVVLIYGYAYANVTPCEGGQVQETIGDWLETAEWEQFDAWLYSRGPTYRDNDYFSGQSSAEMSEAEVAALNDWALVVYARLTQSPILGSKPTEANPVPVETTDTAATCPAPTEKLKLLENDAHGYCLLYPAGYSVDQPNENETVIFVGSLLDVEHPKLFVEVTDAGGRTPDEAADELVAEIQQAMPDFEVKRTSGLLIGSEPAIQLDNMPGQDLSRQVLTGHQDRLYKLIFVPSDETAGETYKQMEELYATVIESFDFLPAEE